MSSTTYSVESPGQTFDTVARRVYGDPFEAGRIARANPGVQEPIEPGVLLTIPAAPQIKIARRTGRGPVPTVSIIVDGQEFMHWETVTVERGLDRIETVSFDAPFEPDQPEFRHTFRPFSYKPVEVFVGDTRIFNGTMVDVSPALSEDRRTVSTESYSLPGVLSDCTPPVSALPLEFGGLNLEEIAKRLAEPFGISVVFEASPGAAFEQTNCEPTRNVLTFLSDLARDRGLVVANDEEGRLVFRRDESAGDPVASLREGEAPLLAVTPEFSPQQYFSVITAIEPVMVGGVGASYSVRNPALTSALRPHNFAVQDVESEDVEESAAAKAGRMIGNAVRYSVDVATWRTPDGQVWTPGQRITLKAPSAMIYRDFEFEVRGVTLSESDSGRSATLVLAIPGSFSGKIPERFPWDE